MSRPPGVFFRASHVLVFFIIFAVLAGGIYAALLALGNPSAAAVAPALSGLTGGR